VDPAQSFQSVVPGALASAGIQADEAELAVMAAAHALYWPGIVALLEADLTSVEPEPGTDMSRGPEGS
jgi:hypothetical protein